MPKNKRSQMSDWLIDWLIDWLTDWLAKPRGKYVRLATQGESRCSQRKMVATGNQARHIETPKTVLKCFQNSRWKEWTACQLDGARTSSAKAIKRFPKSNAAKRWATGEQARHIESDSGPVSFPECGAKRTNCKQAGKSHNLQCGN